MVRKRILVSMRFFLICRADSNDDSPGIPISISTMSGRNSRAFSTASPPSAASPTTSNSIVFHYYLHQLVRPFHLDCDVLCLGVFGHVVQRFLHHSINSLFGA